MFACVFSVTFDVMD